MSHELADLDAEKAVLAAIIIDGRRDGQLMTRASNILRASDFHEPRHELLFSVLQELVAQGEPIDFVTITRALRDRNRFNTFGGREYLSEITTGLSTLVHVEAHCAIVLRFAQARASVQALAEARHEIVQGAHGPLDVVARAMEKLATARARSDSQREATFAQHVDDALERLTAALSGQGREIPTGITAFDGNRMSGDVGHTGGMFDGELWILAAESSGGKTAMALQIARHVAQQRRRVVFFSFEMDPRRLVWRMTARDHQVPAARIKRGQVTADETRALQTATDSVRHLPLDVRGSCTIEEIEGAVLAAKARKGEELGLVVVDYLGLIPATPKIDDRWEDHQRVARYTRALKKLAMRAGVPVLLLAQFTREGNKSGKPTKHDLKGGGSIESDADVVVLLHVDEKSKKLDRREVTVILAKNRDAALGDFSLTFDGLRQVFEAPAPDPRRHVQAPRPWDPDENDGEPVAFGHFTPGGDAE